MGFPLAFFFPLSYFDCVILKQEHCRWQHHDTVSKNGQVCRIFPGQSNSCYTVRVTTGDIRPAGFPQLSFSCWDCKHKSHCLARKFLNDRTKWRLRKPNSSSHTACLRTRLPCSLPWKQAVVLRKDSRFPHKNVGTRKFLTSFSVKPQ